MTLVTRMCVSMRHCVHVGVYVKSCRRLCEIVCLSGIVFTCMRAPMFEVRGSSLCASVPVCVSVTLLTRSFWVQDFVARGITFV